MRIQLVIIIFLFTMTKNYSQQNSIPIVPSPQAVTLQNGRLQLKHGLKVEIKGNSKDSLDFTAKLIKESIKKVIGITSIQKGKIVPNVILEQVNKADYADAPADLIDQSYSLAISPAGIRIKSVSPRGIFYGAMSLIQLLDKSTDQTLPCLNIIDWPDMKIRGVSDDISRGQVSTLGNFERIIKFIARYKMNTYMPYMEDMIKFPEYPSIGKNRGALSEAEVKKLVAFANNYFVDIIPIFQTLGHYENILTQDRFVKYAEFPGAASLNVSSDSAYTFLFSMLKHVFKLFPSVYFHMGADESYDVGLGKSKHLVDEYGIAKVHADHYKKVYDFCKEHGKKVMMYGDIILKHPEILTMLPKDITIVDWHYRPEEDYTSTKTFHDNGFNYIVSPASWNFLSSFPNNEKAVLNIMGMVKSGLKNGAEGMINSNWGDFGAETFKEFVLFDYAWSAQCAWNFRGSSFPVFSDNYFYDFFGINDPAFSSIYAALSSKDNQVTWNEIWRHPLLPFKFKDTWQQAVMMNWGLGQVSAEISGLKEKVKRNKEHFALLQFIVNLDEWYRLKLKTQTLLHSIEDSAFTENNNEVSRLVDENISDLKKLKKEYIKLWLKYYEPANLNMIEDKFDRLTAYFTEINDSLKKGSEYLYSPVIKSEWIYVKEGRSDFAKKAEFERSIKLDSVPDKAYLQLMGDTYARLYINGKYVDNVLAKRSGSLLVDYKRIKFLNVKKYLKKGLNTFLVKVENYNENGSAGFNIASYF